MSWIPWLLNYTMSIMRFTLLCWKCTRIGQSVRRFCLIETCSRFVGLSCTLNYYNLDQNNLRSRTPRETVGESLPRRSPGWLMLLVVRSLIRSDILFKTIYDTNSETDPWKVRLLILHLLEIRAIGIDRWDKRTRSIIGSWSRFMDQYRNKYL